MVEVFDESMANVRVELENRSLWTEFYQCGTEMIITKPGRRMFPDLKFKISGLDPQQYYIVLLDIVPADTYRYKFIGKCWLPAYESDMPQHKSNLYRHPDSPALGSKWMSQSIGFNKLKLTNSNTTSESHITLNSMHKYIPRLRIFAGSDIAQMSSRKFTTFSFHETSFMAVTAYQNAGVTNLKIKNNPFAKGFREEDRRNPVKRSCGQEAIRNEPISPTMISVSKRRQQSASPDVSTTSLSESPSPLHRAMFPFTTLPCPPVPASLSPHSVSSTSPPTYDFNTEVPQTPTVAGAARLPAKMAPPTYFDFISQSYENFNRLRGIPGTVPMSALHHPHNPFYGLPNRFLPTPVANTGCQQRTLGGLPFVSQFNPQIGYHML